MKMRWKTAWSLCVVLALALSVSSCGKQEGASRGADDGDVYALISVDGQRVPASVSHQGATLQVRSGAFTIHADGTCRSKTVFVPAGSAEVVREVSATYTKDGSTLTMQWEGAGRTVGTIEGNTFTMDNEGMLFVYER